MYVTEGAKNPYYNYLYLFSSSLFFFFFNFIQLQNYKITKRKKLYKSRT